MAYSVIMHINFCEQGQSIIDVCLKAASWGYDGVEFRRKRIGVDESRAAYLNEIERGVAASGLKEVLFGFPGPILLSDDADVRKKEISDAVAFYREVYRRFGVRIVNLLTGQLKNPDPGISYFDYTKHGSYIATPGQRQWLVDGVRELADRLSDLELKFAFETHPVYLHDTLDNTLGFVEAIDRRSVGVNFDYGNIVEFENPPSLDEALDRVTEHLHYVHLKNSGALRGGCGRFGTSLAEGEINTRHLLQKLLSIGYRGPLCIEAPRQGDREWFAKCDIAYLRSVLEELESTSRR